MPDDHQFKLCSRQRMLNYATCRQFSASSSLFKSSVQFSSTLIVIFRKNNKWNGNAIPTQNVAHLSNFLRGGHLSRFDEITTELWLKWHLEIAHGNCDGNLFYNIRNEKLFYRTTVIFRGKFALYMLLFHATKKLFISKLIIMTTITRRSDTLPTFPRPILWRPSREAGDGIETRVEIQTSTKNAERRRFIRPNFSHGRLALIMMWGVMTVRRRRWQSIFYRKLDTDRRCSIGWLTDFSDYEARLYDKKLWQHNNKF